MPCAITSGFQLGCRDNTGGIKNIYILSGSISNITGSQGLITGITGSGIFYQFQLFRQTSNFSEEIVATPEKPSSQFCKINRLTGRASGHRNFIPARLRFAP